MRRTRRLTLVALACVACIACGRIGFDGQEGPAVDASDASGAVCSDPASTSACDDGDPCTSDDRCVKGVCGGGPVTACKDETRDVFRSVGTETTALVTATGPLEITGTTAVFEVALPDRVGVGDVLEYDSDADGQPDALAFIHGRHSATAFQVRDDAGGTPAATAATTSWSVFRAYGSLGNAVDRNAGGTRNPNITAAPFDGYAGGRDLVATNERLHLACYDDGLDAAAVQICNTSYTRSCGPDESWTTDATHYLRIFTPVTANEVGVSQRHTGTAASGYRRTNALVMYQGHVRIDGLSLLRTTVGFGRSYYVETQGTGGEVWISNSFGWNSIQGPSKVFDVWDTNAAPVGDELTVLQLWNDIAYNESLDDVRSGFYMNSDRVDAYVYACTSYVKGGGAFVQASGARMTIKNSLGFSEASPAFHTDDGFTVQRSATNDSSLQPHGVTNLSNQTITFRGPADLHLDPAATAVRGIGLDLSADPVRAFFTDIDGDARPAGGWDLGADQVTP